MGLYTTKARRRKRISSPGGRNNNRLKGNQGVQVNQSAPIGEKLCGKLGKIARFHGVKESTAWSSGVMARELEDYLTGGRKNSGIDIDRA